MVGIPNEPLRIEVLADERTIVLDGELDMADTETLTRAVSIAHRRPR